MAEPAVPMGPDAPADAQASAQKAKAGQSKLLLPIVVAVATILGGVVGVLVVAPRLAPARQVEAKKAAGLEPAAAGEDGKGAERGPLFKIDNLIVNPAGSLGTRFLMVSVAIETTNDAMDEKLRRREAEIRDLLIALFEKQTMESLGRAGIRDSLKRIITDTVSTLAGSPTKLGVYLPQFVIQ